MELGKARLSLLVLVTTGVGFVLASPGALDWLRLLWTLAGTAIVALGVNGLNQWLEVRPDGLMDRTKNRPLPSGRLGSAHAFLWSVGLAVTGTLILAVLVNALTAGLGLLVLALYLVFYTPLKKLSCLNTLVGAVCGAVPPMMGWTGAAGGLGFGAWVLGAILFVWQIPHFLALAWLYRHDYARGGFRMLPQVDPRGSITFRIAVVYTLALFPVGLAMVLAGLAGWVYAVGSILLGSYMLAASLRLYRVRSERNARGLFLASIIYLPVLLGLMVLDRVPASVARGSELQAAPQIQSIHIPVDRPARDTTPLYLVSHAADDAAAHQPESKVRALST